MNCFELEALRKGRERKWFWIGFFMGMALMVFFLFLLAIGGEL